MNEIIVVWLILLTAVILLRGVHIHVHLSPAESDVVERLRKMEESLNQTKSELKTAVEETKGETT